MTKKKHDRDGEKIEKLVFDLADRFLAAPDMPEVGIHFMRLQKEGLHADDAKRMIGTVLITNLYLTRKSGAPIDLGQLRSDLAKLPKLGVAPSGRPLDIRGIDWPE